MNFSDIIPFMKKLLVIRHAKASREHKKALPDFERPLTTHGEQEVAHLASALKNQKISPEHIITSSSVRTMSTASLLARFFGYPQKLILPLQDLYEADLDRLVKSIHELNSKWSNVWLIGHNPGVSDLCGFLSPLLTEELPTSGAVYFELPIQNWSALGPKQGIVLSQY